MYKYNNKKTERFCNPFNQSASGLEIKDWVWHHSNHKTCYTNLAKNLTSAFNLDNDKFYIMKKCNDVVRIYEVEEKGKQHEISCND